MRDYGKVSPQFWIGKTGKALRQAGPEAQLVSLYLLTNPHANMIGLYYMPLMFIAHETGLGIEGASKGLKRAIGAGFCYYDDASEMIWVPEMAAHQIGTELNPKDKRCSGVQNEYNAQPENPFLSMFYRKYKKDFNMTICRGVAVQNSSESEGASKGLASQEQEQEQEKEQEHNTSSDSDRTGDDSISGNLPAHSDDDNHCDNDDATDPLSQAFENIFWCAGLRKDAKVKSRTAFKTKFQIWRRESKGTPEQFATMLAQDIKSRFAIQQMGIDRMLPTSYLNGERWNDEIKSQSPTSGTDTAARPYAYHDTESSEVFLNLDAMRSDSGGNRRF